MASCLLWKRNGRALRSYLLIRKDEPGVSQLVIREDDLGGVH